MIDTLSFVVGFTLRGSKERSGITLDPVAMELLGVKEGDAVYVTRGEIFGLARSREVRLKAVKSLPQDIGKKIVRLTEDVQEFQHGDQIMVRGR